MIDLVVISIFVLLIALIQDQKIIWECIYFIKYPEMTLFFWTQTKKLKKRIEYQPAHSRKFFKWFWSISATQKDYLWCNENKEFKG